MNSDISRPLLVSEKVMAYKIMKTYILPTLTATTYDLCTWHDQKQEQKNENDTINALSKKREIPSLTEKTLNGVAMATEADQMTFMATLFHKENNDIKKPLKAFSGI